MVTRSVRAIYTHGQLQLLEPLALTEGQEVEVTIWTERDYIEATLDDLLEPPRPPTSDTDLDVEALLRQIHEANRGLPPVSDLIIEERRNGP